jgi:hypothetical protein
MLRRHRKVRRLSLTADPGIIPDFQENIRTNDKDSEAEFVSHVTGKMLRYLPLTPLFLNNCFPSCVVPGRMRGGQSPTMLGAIFSKLSLYMKTG